MSSAHLCMRLDTGVSPPKIVWIGTYSEGADTLSRDSKTAYAELHAFDGGDTVSYAECVERLLRLLVQYRRLGWSWVVPLLRVDDRQRYDELLAAAAR